MIPTALDQKTPNYFVQNIAPRRFPLCRRALHQAAAATLRANKSWWVERLLRGYPDWLFRVFVLAYAGMNCLAVYLCWPHWLMS